MTVTSLPTLLQRARLYVFRHFLEHAVPPVVEQLMSEFNLSRDDTMELLNELADARSIALVKGTDRILMAWPFSAVATPFRVRARGGDYFANCSWDAIAFHTMLGEADVDIDSFCHHCATPIRIELRSGVATRVWWPRLCST